VSQDEVGAAFPAWEMLSVEPADTTGLGWPLNKTAPQWYRLRREAQFNKERFVISRRAVATGSDRTGCRRLHARA
jgi:hypothetical protein